MKYKKTAAFLTALIISASQTGIYSFAQSDVMSPIKIMETTSDGVEVKSYDDLKSAIEKGEPKIYITSTIEMEDGIKLEKGNQALIGVPNSSGQLPTLDFKNMKGENDITKGKSSDADVGIRISSSKNEIKNLIIEKAHDNGILIKGTNVTKNKVTNCILRYNNDSGMQITGGACGNIINGVLSYRNCDVFTLGGNADGFAIKLGAGPSLTTDLALILENRNLFTNCCAWENSDDAWDSYDKDLPDQSEAFQEKGGYWTYRNDYNNCMCWNNGTPANAMGYTDYINGLSLDENLPFIRRFKELSDEEKYSGFVNSYNSGSLCDKTAGEEAYYKKLDEIFGAIPTSKGEFTASQIALENWGGNPNGFKLGSKFTKSNSLRYMNRCIAFDHEKYGFDKNNSGAKIYAENCISFNNKINYHLAEYTAYKWSNIFGWNGEELDNLPKAAAESLNIAVNGDIQSQKEELIRAAANKITENANSNELSSTDSLFEQVF